jgi:hypothetical protein
MPIDRAVLRARIENAAAPVGLLWPLETFNATNPLLGLEEQPFHEAIRQARALFGGRGYPQADTFRRAWEEGEIDPDVLQKHLDDRGIAASPEALLFEMEKAERDARPSAPADDPLDRAMCRWMAAFVDQGQAPWPMPHRRDGFYAAWRQLAPYDGAVPGARRPDDLPATWVDALADVLAGRPEPSWEPLFEHHLTALPGWVSFIKRRMRAKRDAWQQTYPITLAHYLAVRLTVAKRMGRSVTPDAGPTDSPSDTRESQIAALWLEAWEESDRNRLLRTLRTSMRTSSNGSAAAKRPAAQLVFCIDVRSEIIRRHIEQVGPYETHGYAGFFGIPMQHEAYGAASGVKTCPPIVDPKHRIADRPADAHEDDAHRYDVWQRIRKAGRSLLNTLKSNVAAAFGFVEGSGGFFGAAMAARTLAPSALDTMDEAVARRTGDPNQFCTPTVDRQPDADTEDGLPLGLSHEAKVLYAEAAFQLMGWGDTFAPIVVFAGHGSQTPNNPYKSSLDCGACAGNPGGPNARVLAALCNDPAVQASLRERGIDIPSDTVFLAGQHNTTTDAITLFVDDDDPTVSAEALQRLRADLEEAQTRATDERSGTFAGAHASTGVDETRRRAADWAETRPEWGLAGNAAFIVGPRSLTKGQSLDGRCFLHSYDWRHDQDGTALETILTGPLVVGEWISTQYYFSTVDNGVHGSGSKITHNVQGKAAIVQGNGGDLMTGLPLQSLQTDDERHYHAPLRLMAVVHAPADRVEAILDRQAAVSQLLNNEWVALTVIDPTDDDAFLRYEPGGIWRPASAPAPAPEPFDAVAA